MADNGPMFTMGKSSSRDGYRGGGGGHRHGPGGGYRGRGGGYRGGHPSSSHRGGYQRHQHHQQRHNDQSDVSMQQDSTQEDVDAQLLGVISRYGAKVETLATDLPALVNILIHQKTTKEALICSIFAKCVSQISTHLGAYALILNHLQTGCPDLGMAVLHKVNETFKAALEEYDWLRARIVMRFYAELVNTSVIAPDEFLRFLSAIWAPVQNADHPEKAKDCYAYLVMSALTSATPAFATHAAASLSVFFENNIMKYMTSGRTKRREAFKRMRPYQQALSYEQSDELELVYGGLLALHSAKWVSEYPLSMVTAPAVALLITKCPQLTLPNPLLPLHSSLVVYWAPSCPIRFLPQPYGTQDGRVTFLTPDFTSACAHVLLTTASEMLTVCHENHKEAVTFLTQQPIWLHHQLTSKFDLHQCILQSILGEMFRLPEQTHRLCYYSVLIMDLCTELPAVIPPILGKVFPLLYDSLTASYDTEIYRRLRDWFVHHLSNFGLKWKWKDMIPLVDAPAADPKKQFFLDVLQHLTRLAYVKNVEQAIGPELVRLLPASPKPTFRFIETSDIISDEKVIEIAATTFSLLEKPGDTAKEQETQWIALQSALDRLDAVVIAPTTPWQQTLTLQADDANAVTATDVGGTTIKSEDARTPQEEKEALNWLQREVLTEHVLRLGSKTFSHMSRTLEKLNPYLRELNKSKLGRRHTVRLILAVWWDDHQFLQLTLDKFMNYRIITPAQIIEWVFTDGKLFMSSMWVWDLLMHAIEKVVKRQTEIKKRHDAQEAVARSLEYGINVVPYVGHHISYVKYHMSKNVKLTHIVIGYTEGEGQDKEKLQTAQAQLAGLRKAYDDATREQRATFIEVFRFFRQSLSACEWEASVKEEREDSGETSSKQRLLRAMIDIGRTYHRPLATVMETMKEILIDAQQDEPPTTFKEIFDAIQSYHH